MKEGLEIGWCIVDTDRELVETSQGKYSAPTPKIYGRLSDAKRERTNAKKKYKEPFFIHTVVLGDQVEVT